MKSHTIAVGNFSNDEKIDVLDSSLCMKDDTVDAADTEKLKAIDPASVNAKGLGEEAEEYASLERSCSCGCCCFWNMLVLAVLLLLLGLYANILLIDHAPLLERSDTAEISGVTCDRLSFPVRLSTTTSVSYDVTGELCYKKLDPTSIVQVLVSGAGYGTVYWNPSFQPEVYSYVQAVADRYPTFNYARPGIDMSERPFGVKTNVNVQAFVLNQVIVHLNEHLGRKAEDNGIMVVGHSMGSLIAQAHALKYPATIRGTILTGYLHSVSTKYLSESRETSTFAITDEKFRGKILDFTYLTSKGLEGRRLFYSAVNTDEAMVVWDDETKETLTLGEAITLGSYRYSGNESKFLTVPTLVVSGDEDVINCPSPLVNCTDAAAVKVFEQNFYPPSCAEVIVIPETGHVLNFHLNAMETYASILEWSLRVVGTNTDGAVRRCIPDTENLDVVVSPGESPADWSKGVSPSVYGFLILVFVLIIPALGWTVFWTKIIRPKSIDRPERGRQMCALGLFLGASMYLIVAFLVLFLS